MRGRRWGLYGAGLAAGVLTIGASVAVAAQPGGYSGKTSQHQQVSFTISGGTVSNFSISTIDRCPNGRLVLVHERGYAAMPIRHGKFGGRFTPVGGHPGEYSKISGKLGRRSVAGSMSDTIYVAAEGGLCLGKAHFSAHRV